MTQARRLRLRVEVAGCPLVFVSDGRDAGPLADGRTAVSGLLVEGLALEADLDPVRQELDIRPLQLRVLADRAGDKLRALLRLPSVETYITQDADETAATIYVEDNTGFATGDYAHIGAEVVKVVGTGTDALGDYLDVDRAQWGTEAAAYYAPTDDYPGRSVAVADLPSTYTGRRVHIYVWDGAAWSLEWRGVANGGWSFDGSVFALTVDGITTALEASAAPDRDEVMRAVSVNLPDSPWASGDGGAGLIPGDPPYWSSLRSTVDLFAGSWWSIRIGGVGGSIYTVRVYGWYSDPAAYASALESALNAAHGLTDHRFRVSANADRSLSIAWEIDSTATTPTYAEVGTPGTVNWLPPMDGPAVVSSVSAGYTYTYRSRSIGGGLRFDEAGFLGSVVCGFTVDEDGSTSIDMPLMTDGFTDRFIVDGPVPTGDFVVRYKGPAVLIKNTGGGHLEPQVKEDAEVLLRCVYAAPSTVSVTAVLRHNLTVDRRTDVWLADGFLLPGVRASLQLSSYVAGDYLGTQLANIVALTPRSSSLGDAPALYSADFADLPTDAAMLDALDVASPIFQHKRVAILEAGTTLAEWLSGALVARGVWLGLDAEGRLRFLDDSPTTETASIVATLDESAVTIDEDWPFVEMDPFGRYTRLDWLDDYDVASGDYRLRMSIVDYRATATALRERALRVELRSAPYTRSRWTDYEWRAAIVDTAGLVLSRWAYPYYLVELVTGWSVRLGIGDVVKLDLPKLPDPETGKLGGVRIGRVVGFRRDLDRASNRYRILVRGRRLYGYAPSARITGSVLVSGTTYDLTCVDTTTAGHALYSGYDLDELFPAGSRVRVIAVGSSTAYYGTVDSSPSSPTGTVRVTFTAAPVLSGELFLVYDQATVAVAEQEPWLYFAPAGGSLAFPSGSQDARRYAP